MTRRISAAVAMTPTVLLLAPAVLAAEGFIQERPWLNDRSLWTETGGNVGWWAVGNSHVFAIVGPNAAQAQLSQITGPHIMLANVMNSGSAVGPTRLTLSANGQGVAFSQQSLAR